MKRNIVIGVILFITIVFVYCFFNPRREVYYTLLKKDGVIENRNKNGQLNGEVITFKAGKVQNKKEYSNGLKEGWNCDYYPSGKIKYRNYYHLNEATGPEFQYYENGTLAYKATLRNGVRYGEYYKYSMDNHLMSYSAFDVKGQQFSTFNYNELGDITKVSIPVSINTYSINTKTGIIVPLHFEERETDIKDMYVMIGTPPGAQIKVVVNVNNVEYNNIKIVNNVIRIENAFPNKGLNPIFLKLDLTYRGKKIIENLKGELSILRE